jgi:putative membrane protein insertion efficiency factor
MNPAASILRTAWRFVLAAPSWTLIALVRVYQWTLSPFIGNQCRFHPTCSAYMILAVRKYGAFKGFFLGLWRIAKCNPYHPGGEDYP